MDLEIDRERERQNGQVRGIRRLSSHSDEGNQGEARQEAWRDAIPDFNGEGTARAGGDGNLNRSDHDYKRELRRAQSFFFRSESIYELSSPEIRQAGQSGEGRWAGADNREPAPSRSSKRMKLGLGQTRKDQDQTDDVGNQGRSGSQAILQRERCGVKGDLQDEGSSQHHEWYTRAVQRTIARYTPLADAEGDKPPTMGSTRDVDSDRSLHQFAPEGGYPARSLYSKLKLRNKERVGKGQKYADPSRIAQEAGQTSWS